MKRQFLSFLLVFSLMVFFFPPVIRADEIPSCVDKFIEDIALTDEFSSWDEATAEFAYNLYDEELIEFDYQLYYVYGCDDSYVGYVIIDCNSDTVVEYSLGEAPYDRIIKNACLDYTYIYANGWPECYVDGGLFSVEHDGSLQFISGSMTTMSYDPHLQTGNCITFAITQILWYHGQNGHPGLISGFTFSQLRSKIDQIMILDVAPDHLYKNIYIPGTISNFVNTFTSYSVSVNNLWSPSYVALSTEVANRPCLLGFSSSSPYYSTGHMTVCISASTYNGQHYLGLMDGHSTSIVYKIWGSYNDFMSKVVF